MWPLREARNKFSAAVEAALARRPQVISRRSQPAAVVGSAARYAQLLAQGSGLPDRLTKTAPPEIRSRRLDVRRFLRLGYCEYLPDE